MQFTEQFTSRIVPGQFHCTQVVSSDGTEAAWPEAQKEAGTELDVHGSDGWKIFDLCASDLYTEGSREPW